MGAGAQAQGKKYTFALVPKNMNNPFFDQARDGCKKAEKESNGAIECLYIGPGEHGGGDEQVQVVNDLITKKSTASRFRPRTQPPWAGARGRQEGEYPGAHLGLGSSEKDKALRVAYVGTYNYDIGMNLAKLAQQHQAERRHDLHPVGRRRGGEP